MIQKGSSSSDEKKRKAMENPEMGILTGKHDDTPIYIYNIIQYRKYHHVAVPYDKSESAMPQCQGFALMLSRKRNRRRKERRVPDSELRPQNFLRLSILAAVLTIIFWTVPLVSTS